MTSIEFLYNDTKTIIQGNKDDKIKDIVNKYITKTSIDKNSVVFLNSGKILDEELKLIEMADKQDETIKILVNSEDMSNYQSIVKSKYIICPLCGENIKYKMNNYKIYLYECKNGHRINNILLNEFEKTQLIDISKIKCEECKENNKSNTFNNNFYKCLTCGKNICPLCKSLHDKTHNIINYDHKNYICQRHNELFIKYCNKCKMNICLICENEHKDHNNISYGEMIPNDNKINEYLKELRTSIDILKNNIEEIKNKLDKVIENLEIYYQINNDIINKYEKKNRNYEILQNIIEINNNNILDEINKINNDNDLNNKTNNILNIYNKMVNKDISEINIIYDINKNLEKEEDTINIFGSEFVENNKNICKMIIDNKEYELKVKYNIKNYYNKILKITLKGIDNVTNMSWMFSECSSLSSLPDISEWNTNNVTNMIAMFYKCSSLSSLPDISKWDTSNVTYMSYMFYGCSSLSSLPDISKWNTNNVIHMIALFNGCSSLSSLPDISKWNTTNVTNMSGIFRECSLLSSLPDISKWDTNNVTYMSYMFYGCSSLSSLPDISSWNTNDVTDMSYIFNGCSSLLSLPDISNWNTTNVTNMSGMFRECSSLLSLPDISNWVTNNVYDMSGMFRECSSLTSLPDISKWNTNNVTNMINAFYECKKLKLSKKIKTKFKL